MADTDDVQEYGRKLHNQLEKLATADISEPDRTAIRQFVDYLDVRTDNNQGTIVSNLNRLRLAAERGATPLTDATEQDVTALMGTLKRDHDLAEGTLREYRKALRKFYIWRDVDLSGQPGTVSINEQANVKGASGSVPLTWARGYVASWLDVHPRRDDPDAALIHKYAGHHSAGPDDDGALTYQYLSRRVKTIGERAGIDADRLNTHNFRKSAISRWIREGFSEQEIKHRAFWVKDSRQFETYSGVTDTEMNAQIADRYGIDVDGGAAERPSIDSCPQCASPLREGARFCPGCGAPLTVAAAEERDAVADAVFASAAAADGTEADYFAEFRRRFNEDSAFRERVAGGESGSHGESS